VDVFAPTDENGNARSVANQQAQVHSTELERAIGSLIGGVLIGNTVIYQTRAALFADLAHPANRLGIVYGDSNPAYNGIYAKVGASGTGSWTLTNLALPSTFAADLSAVISAQAASQAEVTEARGGYSDLAERLQALAAAIAAGGGEAGEAIAALEQLLAAEVAARQQALQEEIGAREDADGTLASTIAAEAQTRAQAISAEQLARTQAIQDEIEDRQQAISAEAQTRAEADQTEQLARAQAIADEQEARSTADDVHDKQIYAFGTRQMVDLAKKYARSGYDIVKFGTSGRIISALRRHDNVWVIGSGIETPDILIDSSAKLNRSGVVGGTVDKDGRLIQGQRPREKLHEFGADGIKTRHQAWQGLPKGRFSRSQFPSAEIGGDGRIIHGASRDGILYFHGATVVRGDEDGALAEDYIVYSQAQGSETHIFSERKRDGRRLRLSNLGANHYDPQITRDGKVIWTSDGVLLSSPIDAAAQHRVLARSEFIGVGDSLTAQNYGADLATLSGLPYRNIGRSAQTSLGCAARFGARQMRLISVTGQIPASGSVQVDSLDGLGVLDFYGSDTVSGLAGTVLGVPVTLGYDDTTNVMTLTRTTAGSAISLPPGTPYIWTQIDSITAQPVLNSDEMIGVFFFGRNNADVPDQIFSDFKACVAYLKTLSKRYLIIPFMPSKGEVTGSDQIYRNWIYLMGLCFQEWPDNTINMRNAMIAYAGSEAAYWANLMTADEIHPTAAGRLAIATIINNFRISKGWY
jgi:hypothetical protein